MADRIGMSVDTSGDKVYLQFDRKLEWVELSPQQAVDLADALVRKAMTINEGSKLILPNSN